MPTLQHPLADDRDVIAAADRLERASASGELSAPVRDLLGPADIERAYAVQHLLRTRREAAGARVVGRKVGLTSIAVQQQLGVDQPDFGYLFDDMDVEDGGKIRFGDILQPRVEAETRLRARSRPGRRPAR